MLNFLTRRKKRTREEDTNNTEPLLENSTATTRRSKRQKMSIEETEKQRTIRRRLYEEVMKEIKPIALGSLAMIGSTLSNQAVPRLLGKLLDQKTICAADQVCPANPLASSMSSFLLVVLGGGVASFLRTVMLDRSQDAIAARLRSQAFESLLTKQDLEWFQMPTSATSSPTTTTTNKDDEVLPDASNQEENETTSATTKGPVGMTTGAIGNILQEDVALVAKSMTTTLANLLRSSASILFGSYNMICLNPTLFGLSVTVVPLIGVAAIVVRKQITKLSSKQRTVATQAASFGEERLQHLYFVKMSNREKEEVQTYSELQDEVARLGYKLSIANGGFMGFLFAASSGALLWVIDVGGKSVAAGKMTAGDLTSFATYTFLLGLGTSGVLRAASEFTQGMVSAGRVYELIGITSTTDDDDEKEEEEEATTTTTKATTNNSSSSTLSSSSSNHSLDMNKIDSIELQNVSFSYKSNPTKMVLQHINLKLTRGKVTCLVGKNGSGKSTLAMILAALYKPLLNGGGGGTIQLSDGTNYLNDLNRTEQKKVVQVVPQNPALFHSSILENVRYSSSRDTTSESDVIKALELANCMNFISQSKNGGIHAQVGPMGCKLSGGQRQRIGLARALLYPRPLLLVLDEPTSALDAEGEEAVSNAIESCRGTTTDNNESSNNSSSSAVLLITHRPKSLEWADEIIVMSEGTIVERGTLQELKSNPNSELSKLYSSYFQQDT